MMGIDLNGTECVILAAFSLALPLSIFFGRGRIRKRRLAAVTHLQQMALRHLPDKSRFVLSFFELVRARYEHARILDPREKPVGYAAEIMAYLPPTLIFVVLSAMGFYHVLATVDFAFESRNLLMIGLAKPTDPAAAAWLAEYQAGTALIVSAGFLGAYIWSINYLILRVANFDLTPLDFLRVSVHVVLTTLIAGVFRHFVAVGSGEAFAAATVLLIAFLMGLFPSLGLNTLVDRLPASIRLKRVVAEASAISREFPLDLIDGIDSAIKFRLGNYDINDAQNLATANPVGLYVATPFSLVEILDWIAQAQLLIAIGPKNYLEARKQSVRDVQGLLDAGLTKGARALLKPLLFDQEMVNKFGQEITEDVLVAKLKSIARPHYETFARVVVFHCG